MEFDEESRISPPAAGDNQQAEEAPGPLSEQLSKDQTEDSRQHRKRKRFDTNILQHGSRAKWKDLGRAEWR